MNKTRDSQQSAVVTILVILVIILAVAIMAVLAFVAINQGIIKLPSGTSNNKATSHIVTYRVRASQGTAGIVYTKADGTMSDRIWVKTPWQLTLTISSTRVYLITANPEASGDLECEILEDGVSVKREHVDMPIDKVGCDIWIP